MNGRFSLSALIHSGPRSRVYAGEDKLYGQAVAVKLTRNAEREVRNMLLAEDCDPRKVNALVMRRAVDHRELCFEGAEGPRVHQAAKAVVTPLHGSAPSTPPVCPADSDVRKAMLPYFESVAELHARSGLEAHCDVKFANFVRPLGLDPDARCLVDLELAQPRYAGSTYRKRGSPAFMPPESTLWGDVNPYVDSWALGIMLFQACHPGQTHPYFDKAVEIGNDSLHRAMASLTYSDSMWSNVDAPLASDLARFLLADDARARPSPVEALQHPALRPV